MSTNFWIISVPTARNSESREQNTLRRATEARKLSHNSMFRVPQDLRVGTLDSLMSLSDELGKMDQTLDSFVKKLHRTYSELAAVEFKGVQKFPAELQVEGKIPAKYVQEFAWNQAKYPINVQLRELSQMMSEFGDNVNKSLSARLSKLNEARGLLHALDRKEAGNLMTRPLGNLVERSDIVEGEYMVTVLVVVARSRKDEFLETYETLENERTEQDQQREKEELQLEETARLEDIAKLEERAMELNLELPELDRVKLKKNTVKCGIVVPKSAKLLVEDEDYVLFRVVVLRKGLKSFSAVCRQMRFNVRTFKLDDQSSQSLEEEKDSLTSAVRTAHLSLLRWCQPQFSDLFSAWVHLKAVRTFVESVLRFGLPVRFTAQLIQPLKGKAKTLRKTLMELYQHLGGGSETVGGETNGGVDFSGTGTEFYPYVYLSMKVGEESHN
eukprot:159614_1